jgi:hydrogenase nickel incorporation protein HypA/HybF
LHELAIACDLVALAEDAARAADAKAVAVVHVRIGALSGVVPEALLLGCETAVKGTLLEGARFIIEGVPARAFCPICQRDIEPASLYDLRCPICASPIRELITGREIELSSMEIIAHDHQTA